MDKENLLSIMTKFNKMHHLPKHIIGNIYISMSLEYDSCKNRLYWVYNFSEQAISNKDAKDKEFLSKCGY